MKITWRDAITTISTAGAVVFATAYYQEYDWPLVSNINWVICGLAALGLITLAAGFAFDKLSNDYWDLVGVSLALALGSITALGLSYPASGYVITMLIGVIVCWLASLIHHFMEHDIPKGVMHA